MWQSIGRGRAPISHTSRRRDIILQERRRMPVRTRASLQELSAIAGKAELVDGEVVEMAPTGDAPGTAADEIYFSLRKYVETTGAGHAVSDNKAFRVNLPHRQTVSPDAAYYTGPRSGMKFYPVAPVFAAEVRSENDYGL